VGAQLSLLPEPALLIQAMHEPDGASLGRVQVANTVNGREATNTNSIRALHLDACWKDPSLDPRQRVIYYVQVFEIPMPNWTTCDS
jgi:hypothetical protein